MVFEDLLSEGLLSLYLDNIPTAGIQVYEGRNGLHA
jgi:hypothetical protein